MSRKCATIKAGRQICTVLLLVAARWWDHVWVMFSCCLILVCYSKISTWSHNQHIIKIKEWGAQEDSSTVDMLEENHATWELLRGLALPQWRLPSTRLWEKRARPLWLGLNRTQRTRPPERRRGTYIFLQEPVETREGAHFCYNQLVPDFVETAALAISLLPSATFVENLARKLGWAM